MKDIASLGEQQRRLVEILWDQGPSTVQEVLDRVNDSNRVAPLAYTTILTLLQNLERSGWARHEKIPGERAYRYAAAREKGEAVRETFAQLTKKLFDGNAPLLFRHLLDDEKLSEADRDEILAMIKNSKEKS